MKKALLASILGAAFSVVATSSYAQGRVVFANYGYTTSAPVTYGPGSGGSLGAGVNDTFTAGLYYFLGTANLGAGNEALAGFTLASITQGINTGAVAGPAGVGLFVGNVANILDYTTGPITFVVTAFNGADYASSLIRGHSAAFTLNSIATGATPTGEFGPGLTSFSVTLVPEPTTFALAGLGAAAMLIVRRRQ